VRDIIPCSFGGALPGLTGVDVTTAVLEADGDIKINPLDNVIELL
jgi:hypothetical protein